jgi:excisionase family DNA binding protein
MHGGDSQLDQKFQIGLKTGDGTSKPLLTVEEAARYLAVSVSTLYGWVWQRRIPFVKLGRALRFDPHDLEAFVEANKHHPRFDFSISESRAARCYNKRAAGKG